MPQNARIYEKVHLKFPIHVMQTDEKLGLSIEKSQEPSSKDGVKVHKSYSMAKDEFKEKHLQAAIVQKSTIPTPEFELIDQRAYRSLYAMEGRARSPSGEMSLLSSLTDSDDDYDADDEDHLYLEHHPRIPVLKFEKIIVLLEKSANSKKVLTESQLQKSKVAEPLKSYDITSIYDYWINKRSGVKDPVKPLMPRLKLKQENSKIDPLTDPYIVFFQKEPKSVTLTREIRKKDYGVYMRAVNARKRANELMKLVEKEKKTAETDHADLKRKYNNLRLSHRYGNSNLPKDETDEEVKTSSKMRKLSCSTKSTDEGYDDEDETDCGPYDFVRTRSRAKYHKPI